MEDSRNNILGIILISALFFVFMWYNQQIKTKQGEDTRVGKTEKTTDNRITSPSNATNNSHLKSQKISHLDSTKVPLAYQKNIQAKVYFIQTELLDITINGLGGEISKVVLRKFNNQTGNPVVLFDKKTSQKNYQFYIKKSSETNQNQQINTNEIIFESTSKDSTILKGDEKQIISLKAEIGENQFIEQIYTIRGNSYLIDYDFNLTNMGHLFATGTAPIKMSWTSHIINHEKEIENERRQSSIYYKQSGDVKHLDLNKDDEQSIGSSTTWVSFKQQFFNTTLLYADKFEKGLLKVQVDKADTSIVKQYDAELYFPIKSMNGSLTYAMQYYFGPNDFNILKKTKTGLENIIQLSSDFFLFKWTSYINKWIIIPIFNILKPIGNYGVIILILTLLIKLALFPLTYKSYKSMAAMRVLKPELDEIREKYKNDQQKMGTAQMQLYQKAGVSPVGGCLPMLLQMPMLVAMYTFFPSSIELRQKPFLWASDLSSYDSIFNLPFSIPFYGSHISLFTILMTISSILYARANSQVNIGGGNPSLKWMPYIFPFFLMFVFNKFSSGLTYYYFLSNIITFGQQFLVNRFLIDEDKIRQSIESNKKKKPKKGGFQARLEKMAREAQKQQAQRQHKKK